MGVRGLVLVCVGVLEFVLECMHVRVCVQCACACVCNVCVSVCACACVSV